MPAALWYSLFEGWLLTDCWLTLDWPLKDFSQENLKEDNFVTDTQKDIVTPRAPV